MSEAIPTRAWSPKSAALAVMTVLALLIAPVCAPICAAKTCLSRTHQQPCHGIATVGADDTAQRLVAPSNACGAHEFSAVLNNGDERASLSRGLRNTSASSGINGSAKPRFGISKASLGLRHVHRIPLAPQDFVLRTIILRI